METDLSFKEPEKLSEGWVTFYRYYCKEGYIDRWMGDCINDPNNETINRMQLNASTTYYRLNDGKWIHYLDLTSGIHPTIIYYKELFTAKEIWESHEQNNNVKPLQ